MLLYGQVDLVVGKKVEKSWFCACCGVVFNALFAFDSLSHMFSAVLLNRKGD